MMIGDPQVLLMGIAERGQHFGFQVVFWGILAFFESLLAVRTRWIRDGISCLLPLPHQLLVATV